MESYEATREVFTRLQKIDPENASKVMGYILLQNNEKDMIRFAYGPENVLISLVNKAKSHLGISSNTLSASMASSISNPISISRPNPLSLSLNGLHPSSPSSPSLWSLSPTTTTSPHSLSYAAVVNGSNNVSNNENVEFVSSPGCRSDSVLYPFGNTSSCSSDESNVSNLHRRSVSFNDVLMYHCGGNDDGFGFKPCVYYSKGFCKNGTGCKFVHDFGDSNSNNSNNNNNNNNSCVPQVGSPSHDDFLRSKLAHQHRLAAQLMASSAGASAGGGVGLPFNKFSLMPFDAQRSAAMALMGGDEFHHQLNRVRMARNEYSCMSMRGDLNPGSRQIYLTFPADSTFKEEDVSQYFSQYGPVQDVRIPYQQKRMFGFVTFVYSETVNIILAKGNPHFVCNSRVLVKPYKEKGKLPDKKQHMDRGDFSCSSPSGYDCREPFDFQLGGRMFYNTQEMLLKKKMEDQADFQQALELQSRRMMNFQLADLKNQPHQFNVSVGSPVLSPNMSNPFSNHNQNATLSSNGMSQVVLEEHVTSPTDHDQDYVEKDKDNAGHYDSKFNANGNGNVHSITDDKQDHEELELPENLEHVLPDNLFASPTKSAYEHESSVFSPGLEELEDATAITNSSAATPLNTSPLKSCFLEIPRLASGHGTIGM